MRRQEVTVTITPRQNPDAACSRSATLNTTSGQIKIELLFNAEGPEMADLDRQPIQARIDPVDCGCSC